MGTVRAWDGPACAFERPSSTYPFFSRQAAGLDGRDGATRCRAVGCGWRNRCDEGRSGTRRGRARGSRVRRVQLRTARQHERERDTATGMRARGGPVLQQRGVQRVLREHQRQRQHRGLLLHAPGGIHRGVRRRGGRCRGRRRPSVPIVVGQRRRAVRVRVPRTTYRWHRGAAPVRRCAARRRLRGTHVPRGGERPRLREAGAGACRTRSASVASARGATREARRDSPHRDDGEARAPVRRHAALAGGARGDAGALATRDRGRERGRGVRARDVRRGRGPDGGTRIERCTRASYDAERRRGRVPSRRALVGGGRVGDAEAHGGRARAGEARRETGGHRPGEGRGCAVVAMLDERVWGRAA